jgi:hypothetical protein
VAVDDTGKNVATTVIYKQDYVIASDGSENSASGYCITDRIDVSANQVYIFSFTRWQAGNTDPIRVGTYKADGTFISRISINNGDTLTVPANCAYVRLSYCNTPNQSTYLYDVQMELGSTATAYEPYAHSSATIQLGTSEYADDINSDTGVISITSVKIKGNSPTWTKHSTSINNVYITDTSESVKPSAHDTATDSICSDYEHKSWDNVFVANAIGFAISNNGRFAIANPNIATLSAFETAIADADICYELATPTTIQLTPEQLQMLKGYNRVTIDNGSIELGYIAKLT